MAKEAAAARDGSLLVVVRSRAVARGALFLSRSSDKVTKLTPGTPLANGGHPRQLVEALTGGHLHAAVNALPPAACGAPVSATRQGFLAGLNEILLIGGIVALVGAALALFLVREREIERDAPATPTAAPQPSLA